MSLCSYEPPMKTPQILTRILCNLRLHTINAMTNHLKNKYGVRKTLWKKKTRHVCSLYIHFIGY